MSVNETTFTSVRKVAHDLSLKLKCDVGALSRRDVNDVMYYDFFLKPDHRFTVSVPYHWIETRPTRRVVNYLARMFEDWLDD